LWCCLLQAHALVWPSAFRPPPAQSRRASMGLLSFCLGSSSATVQPAPGSAPALSSINRGASSPDDAEALVSQLTQAQQMELQGAFRQFDVNGNGTIDQAELKTVMVQLGCSMSTEEIRGVLDQLDIDRNGQIEWKEFAIMMADRWLRQDGETDMALALGLVTDEDDDIDVDSLKALLCGHGERPLSKEEWAQFMKVADPGSTGTVTAKSFKSLPCWEPPPKPPLPKRHNWDVSPVAAPDVER